jgi:hypothetical protein
MQEHPFSPALQAKTSPTTGSKSDKPLRNGTYAVVIALSIIIGIVVPFLIVCPPIPTANATTPEPHETYYQVGQIVTIKLGKCIPIKMWSNDAFTRNEYICWYSGKLYDSITAYGILDVQSNGYDATGTYRHIYVHVSHDVTLYDVTFSVVEIENDKIVLEVKSYNPR